MSSQLCIIYFLSLSLWCNKCLKFSTYSLLVHQDTSFHLYCTIFMASMSYVKKYHGNSLTIKLNFFGHRHCKIPCMLTSFWNREISKEYWIISSGASGASWGKISSILSRFLNCITTAIQHYEALHLCHLFLDSHPHHQQLYVWCWLCWCHKMEEAGEGDSSRRFQLWSLQLLWVGWVWVFE